LKDEEFVANQMMDDDYGESLDDYDFGVTESGKAPGQN
jgi:hypothetical protein